MVSRTIYQLTDVHQLKFAFAYFEKITYKISISRGLQLKLKMDLKKL